MQAHLDRSEMYEQMGNPRKARRHRMRAHEINQMSFGGPFDVVKNVYTSIRDIPNLFRDKARLRTIQMHVSNRAKRRCEIMEHIEKLREEMQSTDQVVVEEQNEEEPEAEEPEEQTETKTPDTAKDENETPAPVQENQIKPDLKEVTTVKLRPIPEATEAAPPVADNVSHMRKAIDIRRKAIQGTEEDEDDAWPDEEMSFGSISGDLKRELQKVADDLKKISQLNKQTENAKTPHMEEVCKLFQQYKDELLDQQFDIRQDQEVLGKRKLTDEEKETRNVLRQEKMERKQQKDAQKAAKKRKL